jgi:hypothetical protein
MNYESNFTVGVEQLTPLGMRQRFLLGKYQALTHYRFGGFEDSKNFSESNFREIEVKSTGEYRSIMSGYSELLGFVKMTEQSYGDDYLLLSPEQVSNL